jgi:phosphoglycolate phosphatase
LFIVSNCLEGYIEIFLKKYNFEKYFIETANAASGITKAQNIKNLVKKHNLKTPIYVGDTIKDKESSDEAGVKFIYASYGFGEVICDNKIEKLEDLLNL